MSGAESDDPAPPLGPQTRRKLDSMWVDWYTAQVVGALAEARIEPIVLKGPAMTAWLYADAPGLRSYVDADLLVAPHALAPAESVLAELGFEVEDLPWLDAEQPHAKSWRRPSDGAVVDLHRVPRGCERLDAALVWQRWLADAESLEVGGRVVRVPSVPARALQLVLATLTPAERGANEHRDLERAWSLVDPGAWHRTAALASDLGLEREFGYALSRNATGADLAGSLGLPSTAPPRLLFDADPLLRAVTRLREVQGYGARLRYAVQRLFPAPAYVRERHPARGVPGAYVAWAASVLARLPSTLRLLWRASRRS